MTVPEGLIYMPGFVTEAEERDVLAVLATFELHPYVLHDTPSRRLVRASALPSSPARTMPFGGADPRRAGVARKRCAGLMEREPGGLADLLVTRYRPGAGIGWHRDAPQFGEVSGVSLLTACRIGSAGARPAPGRRPNSPGVPLRVPSVRSGAGTMEAPHPYNVTQERWSMTSAPCGALQPACGERVYAPADDRTRPQRPSPPGVSGDGSLVVPGGRGLGWDHRPAFRRRWCVPDHAGGTLRADVVIDA